MSDEIDRVESEDPQWDVPGWDWDENDFSWLHSESGIEKDGVSIFFIHGGRIRHQARIKYGSYDVETFVGEVRKLAEGLDDPTVMWLEDTGGGYPGLWVDGMRPPNGDDLERLTHARERRERQDRQNLADLKRRRPKWFAEGAPHDG